MTKKNLFKRIASVAMAGVLTLSMALPVGAATNDPNLVVEPNTLYSTQIEAGKSVTLGLMPANAYYQRTGFDSKADAENGLLVDKVTIGSDKLVAKEKFTYGAMQTEDGTWAGTVTVTGAEGEYGPASLHIINTENKSAYIDMTVYVEAEEIQDAVKTEEVQVVDVSGTTAKVKATGKNLSAAAAKANTANPFYESAGSAQTYPTAADTLYSLAEAKGLTFTQNDGYVESITTSAGEKLEAYTDTSDWSYYGWNYCVVRDGEKVSEGDYLSASVLEVEEGDSVYWAFGTMAQAADYFEEVTE